MARREQTALVWFFAFIGATVPIVFTVIHLLRSEAFGVEDTAFWPAARLLTGKTLTTFEGAALFALACTLNIAWYLLVGQLITWLVAWIASRIRRDRNYPPD